MQNTQKNMKFTTKSLFNFLRNENRIKFETAIPILKVKASKLLKKSMLTR